MEHFLTEYLRAHQSIGYLLFLVLMTIEGQTVLFAGAFLAHEGFFHILPILILSMVGVIGTDYFWYYVGRFLSRHFHWFRKISDRLGSSLDQHLYDHPNHTLAIAKFTFGLHTPVMLRASTLKIPVRNFWKGDVFSSFAWIAIVFSIGYGSGATFSLLRNYFHYTEIGLGVTFILFLILTKLTGRWLRKKI